MSTNGLEVRLHEGRERAEVTRVTWTLNEVVKTLRAIDGVYLLRGTRATWVLADMTRINQDLVVRMEARSIPVKRPLADMLVPVNALLDGAVRLGAEPALPPLFPPNAAQRVAALANPAHGVQSVSLAAYNGTTSDRVELSQAVQQNALAAIDPAEVTYGSVTGHISRLAERSSGSVGFTVRQEGTRQAVDGRASDLLSEQLRAAWRHRVVLGGKLRRNARGQVIRIDVDELDRLPEDTRGRPRAAEIAGAAPHWAGGMSMEKWLREVRHA